ncbi:MAG: MoaD/ThiS family protein [Planctomycetota bacterium]
MKVSVKLFASLARGRKEQQELELGESATVAEMLEALGIRQKEAKAVFRNARHARADERLADGDRVDIFPAIGGG